MATTGIPNDVNNSLFQTNAYPVGRAFGYVPPAATSFDMRNNYVGELGGLNQDYRAASVTSTNAAMASTRGAPMMQGDDEGTKPAIWWVTFAIIFIIVAWAARRFAPDGESFAIIKPNLINWLFITLTVILTIVFLKQAALRLTNVPAISALAKLILSV